MCNAYNLRHRNEAILDIARVMQLSLDDLPEFPPRHRIGIQPEIRCFVPLNGIDDGLTGRSVASLDFAPDFGIFRPTLAVNGGGVYGKGVQDVFVAGPEVRFDVAPMGGFNIGIMAAYDYQLRCAGMKAFSGPAWTSASGSSLHSGRAEEELVLTLRERP